MGLGWWLLLPAWTAPDEPGHYLYARLLAELGRRPLLADVDATSERMILHSLAERNWWDYLDRPAPEPLPSRLSADHLLAASGQQLDDEPPLFYIIPAFVLQRLSASFADDPAQALRWLRLWPLALRLGAVLVALWLAQRRWPQSPARVLGLGLLVGGLPMVGFIGGSLNNDALALFWGALAFTLIALPSPFSRLRVLSTAVIIAAGPIWVDASLLYLWPLALLRLAWGRPRSRPFWAGIVLVAVLLLAPVPRWAAGWRRQPAFVISRSDRALAALPSPGQTTRLVQHIAGKQVLTLRNRPLELIATGKELEIAGLTLSLTDDNHTMYHVCASQARCLLRFTAGAGATFVRIEVMADRPARFHLRLTDDGVRDLLFNGDGALPDRLGSPLFTYLERRLPVPAGYFVQALTPGAWDAPSQFRYLLFAGFTWASFWGYFGWLSRPFPWPIYVLLAVVTLAAGWGICRLLFTPSFAVGAPAPPSSVVRSKKGNLPLLYLSLTALALLLAQVWLPMVGQSWQPQGRYLFAGLLPVAILLLLGWETVLPKTWCRRLPLILAAGLAVLNLLAWRIVIG